MNELMQKLADYHVALEAEKHLAEPVKRGCNRTPIDEAAFEASDRGGGIR